MRWRSKEYPKHIQRPPTTRSRKSYQEVETGAGVVVLAGGDSIQDQTFSRAYKLIPQFCRTFTVSCKVDRTCIPNTMQLNSEKLSSGGLANAGSVRRHPEIPQVLFSDSNPLFQTFKHKFKQLPLSFYELAHKQQPLPIGRRRYLLVFFSCRSACLGLPPRLTSRQ